VYYPIVVGYDGINRGNCLQNMSFASCFAMFSVNSR